MASKRRNMFQKNKTQETTENVPPLPESPGGVAEVLGGSATCTVEVRPSSRFLRSGGVMMFISGEREALVLKLPLIVGNIPLKKHFPLLADKDEAESFGLVTLPRQVQHRYAALPAVTSKASVNPAQSDCVYKLSDFTPRYLVYIPKTLLH
ncbi:hypothetical protein AAG570_003875 [Ranatra chinensis]|uniref:Uncharacterized protein n=1 Tax=Ranatra chinensis TaxID=642074 RepID=A0ABD0YQM6_9HEMI